MAEILPFQALRYDASRYAISDLVTQPYDKITPEMQRRYYAASPYNLVRIILGEQHTADNAQDNVYTRAAEYLKMWRAPKNLLPDTKNFPYSPTQEITPPRRKSPTYTRKGFIPPGKSCEYAEA